MKETINKPSSSPESSLDPRDPRAFDFLRQQFSQPKSARNVNGRLPRYNRRYEDGSILKLFLDPIQETIEVGYYSWPPVGYPRLDFEQKNLENYDLAASVIHEFLPDWHRHQNLLYSNERTRPSHTVSSHAFGAACGHYHHHKLLSPLPNSDGNSTLTPTIESVFDQRKSRDHAMEQLKDDPVTPRPVSKGEKLTGNDRFGNCPRLTDWLRPIMHEHHNRRFGAKIRVGHYGPLTHQLNGVDLWNDYNREAHKSAIAAEVVSEFMPGWEVSGCFLVPKGSTPPPSNSKQDGYQEDGYRVCRLMARDYITKIEPWRDYVSDPVPRYWASLAFFEMRDQALFGGNGRTYSLPHDITRQPPVRIWSRNYPDGSQLRIVYEPDILDQGVNGSDWGVYNKDSLGLPISRERLENHDKVVFELTAQGVVPPPPQGQCMPILKTYSPQEAKDRGQAFFWSF